MIPLRLHIKNFLSYGTPVQTINFEPYHLICLSGKNGHGKSALLDALTWALWGEARKAVNIHKADDALVRLGQSHMMVAIDFNCNGEIYRVRREYILKGSRGTASLDLGIRNHTTGKLQQLTEKHMRDTQALINRIIGLDFEAFENSAFLRQGESDAFSRQTPQDRKEVLSNIIGIGLYETLRKSVAEKNKLEQMVQRQVAHTCTLLTNDARQYYERTEQLNQLQQQHERVRTELEHSSREHHATLAQLKLLHTEYHALTQEIALLKHIDQQIGELSIKLQDLFSTWRTVHRESLQATRSQHLLPVQSREEIVRTLASITESMNRRMIAMKELTTAKEEVQRYSREVTERYRAQQLQEEAILQQLSAQQTLQRQQLEALIASHQELTGEITSITETIAARTVQLQRYTHHTERIAANEKELEQQREHLQRAVAHCHRIVYTLQQTEQIINALTTSPTAQRSQCNLCLQPLSSEEAEQLITLHTRTMGRATGQRQRIERYIKACHHEIGSIHQQIQQLRKEQEGLVSMTTEIELLKARATSCSAKAIAQEAHINELHETSHRLKSKIAAQSAAITVLRGTLDQWYINDTNYQQLINEVTALEEAVDAAPDHQHRYHLLQQELAMIAAQEATQAQKAHACAQQEERAGRIRELCNELRRLRVERMPLAARAGRAAAITELQQREEAKLQTLNEQIATLTQRKEQLIQQEGALQQAVHHSAQQSLLLAQEQQRLAQIEENIADYTILAQALSKDGIQGMLIEHILPEIEHEANRLLGRLTDHQAQLRFESIRELKSGGVKETLDIKISDALGIRPYEFFSGGEAFRIDFALRLAIAKLLARRAGASLQTLIIDEGFGSQDEEGLHNIMEALYAVQSEFAKIIIVSHLSSMKDQFPVHFHVYKGAQGSTVRVVEQG